MRKKWLIVLVALLLRQGNAVAEPGYAYTVTSIELVDLGTLGGSQSVAYGINDLGDIVGSASAAGNHHAFFYTAGVMYDIHDPAAPMNEGVARSVNNSRVVVGDLADTQGKTRPFYYYPGIWLQLMDSVPDPFSQFDWAGGANAINDAGRIVGWVKRLIYSSDASQPIDVPGQLCYLQLPVSWSQPVANPQRLFCIADPDNDGKLQSSYTEPKGNDINSSGNIVGADAHTSSHSMFIYRSGGRAEVPPPAFAPVNDTSGEPLEGVPRGINDKNSVVGGYRHWVVSDGAYRMQAFFWDGSSSSSQFLPLPTGFVASEAARINEQRFVVGNLQRPFEAENLHSVAGFIWHADFGTIRLPALAWSGNPELPENCNAHGLNNLKPSGLVQVVGYCKTGSGFHAVRWDVHTAQMRTPVPR